MYDKLLKYEKMLKIPFQICLENLAEFRSDESLKLWSLLSKLCESLPILNLAAIRNFSSASFATFSTYS